MPTVHEWQCRPAGAYFFAMLVSAAIEPYKKSYGNSLNNAATLGGSSCRERITASPRNTCVPGVQACATAGASTTNTTANQRQVGTRTGRPPPGRRAGRRRSDPKTFALPPNRPAQVLELGFDGLVDRLARAADVVGNVPAKLPHHRPQR